MKVNSVSVPCSVWKQCIAVVPKRALLTTISPSSSPLPGCRDSTEELMEMSEEERSELMKKESSRLLKTGHRVSYSPRKEKALKIYLDGGPAKDSSQD